MSVDVILAGVNKHFGANHVVRNVNLTVPARHFVTLLGPSGCGKTTLLRMIAGLEKVTSGDIRFGERRINLVRPGERDVAMVFQNYALYPNMNVFNNIAYGLRVRGTPRREIRAKVEEAARILEIGHLLDRKPRQLSGGQRQRVALGRAMVRDPVVFLMDEPLSNLDAQLRVTMRAELKRVHRRLSTTTIYVTHDQLEAMTMSDLIAVMRDGAVLQLATPKEIYDHPATRFVAGFIGSPPMNLLQAALVADGADPALTIAGQRLAIPASLRTAVSEMPGRADGLVLGLRPQDLSLAAPDAPSAVAGRVDLVELLGSEKLVTVNLDPKTPVVVQVKADVAVRTEETVGVRPDPQRLHLFAEDGRAVAQL